MPNIQETLHIKFADALQKAYPNAPKEFIEIAQSKDKTFGHYQFNSAMKLAKPLGKNPKEIAAAIVSALDKEPEIATTEIAGPGFVNITLSANYLNTCVNRLAKSERLGVELPQERQKVIVEFSSPNIAKELHVGHLRSTIIGDCLARLLEFLGHDVLRINHIGDWGTQFGMLIAYMREHHPKALDGQEPTTLANLADWYKKSKELFDRDSAFKKQAQLEVVALQSGQSDSLKIWNLLCRISRKSFEEIYTLLDIQIIERGESFYNPMLPEIVEELNQKGLVTESDGAKCLFPPGFVNRDGEPLPLMLQKSDGGYGYDTTDMAAVKQRVFAEKADRVIYVTDSGQSTHFQMIFKAAEMAGWLKNGCRLEHVPFGLVLGTDGKKFKTRSGTTEKLIDLLYEAVRKSQEILLEKNPGLEESERNALAHALGIAAVKYADLSGNRVGDYTFSYERMLRFEGNTAAYLMYVYVRIASIRRKGGKEAPVGEILLVHPSEQALGLHLIQFSEALKQVEKELLPNRLTDYLYGLAEAFNAFYRDCQVEGSNERDSRMQLAEATARVMRKGLHLLGVEVVERM